MQHLTMTTCRGELQVVAGQLLIGRPHCKIGMCRGVMCCIVCPGLGCSINATIANADDMTQAQ